MQQLYQPTRDSHKGQNGRLLVIGGSELFHASIFWSADVASKIVDLVHFTSPANENNDLVRQKIKAGFWNGIVVDFGDVEEYIKEDDCVLIGPGMERNQITERLTNKLLNSYPEKKWVVDGGALQMVEPKYLNGKMIITPHQGEWERLINKSSIFNFQFSNKEKLIKFSKEHQKLTILLKGEKDIVCQGEEILEIAGGNAGLTKGGTGDVLAGLAAALYCKNEALLAAQIASKVNKLAGEELAKRVGNYYSAGDLVGEVPRVLARLTAA